MRVLVAAGGRCGSVRAFHEDEARLLNDLGQPFGCDPGHDVGGCMHAFPAQELQAMRQGVHELTWLDRAQGVLLVIRYGSVAPLMPCREIRT